MSIEDQRRWDAQYQNRRATASPATFLRECVEGNNGLRACGKALDLACGTGENAHYLAERGFVVTALDISSVALDKGRRLVLEQNLTIEWQQADLEIFTLPFDEYDLIINFNYLQRSLVPPIKRSVKKGGRVIFETYLIDQANIGHPKNPDYLLKHNELLDYFRDFRVLHYREGKFADNDTPSYRAGIYAERRA